MKQVPIKVEKIWTEVYIKNYKMLYEYNNIKNLEIQSWCHETDNWKPTDRFLISGYYRYRKKEEEIEYYGYEDFKDEVIQILTQDGVTTNVIELSEIGINNVYGRISFNRIKDYEDKKWRKQIIIVDSYDDDTGLCFRNPKLGWSEWKSFRKE